MNNKILGVIMRFVPIIFFFLAGHIANAKVKPEPSFAQITYLLTTLLMLFGIYFMATDTNKVPKMSKWTRAADILLLILFVGTAIGDFLHRYDQAVTTLNTTLMILCSTSLYLHEKVRDMRVAKWHEATKADDEKRVLGETTVMH